MNNCYKQNQQVIVTTILPQFINIDTLYVPVNTNNTINLTKIISNPNYIFLPGFTLPETDITIITPTIKNKYFNTPKGPFIYDFENPIPPSLIQTTNTNDSITTSDVEAFIVGYIAIEPGNLLNYRWTQRYVVNLNPCNTCETIQIPVLDTCYNCFTTTDKQYSNTHIIFKINYNYTYTTEFYTCNISNITTTGISGFSNDFLTKSLQKEQ